MYVSPFTEITDRAEIAAIVRGVAVANVITCVGGVLQCTLLPVRWDGGERLIAHAAKGNPQFTQVPEGSAFLAVVTGPDAYVSPTWYPSTLHSHRSVPTWNYAQVQLSGTLTVRTDPEWLLGAVADLSEHHAARHEPWSLDESPEKFVAGQLLGIVGLDMHVTAVQAKAKLSQNRTGDDRVGVIAGLRGEDDPAGHAVANLMAQTMITQPPVTGPSPVS